MRRELILNAAPGETRAVLLEDGLPAEVFVERSAGRPLVGNIYRGRVRNVLPGMQSAFVDIGLDRDAFLYVTDLLPPEPEEDLPSPPEPDLRPAKRRGPPIEQVVSAGREILVQVTKEAIGGKGPRVTAQISFAGQRLVFLPASPHRAVSRRIEPEEERERLRLLLAALPGEGGFIARTAATGSGPRELEAEAEEIRERWEEVRRRADTAPVPSCVHEEIDLALRVLRDFAGADLERVVVDREEAHRRCREHAERYLPGLAPRIERFEGVSPIFEAFGVERELQRALRRRVWLPSGGYIVIHPTEALVAIDVNTGKYVGKRRFEETALQTNVEAAREIVRQIRLRDLGGILVIDFIDLEEDESRRQLAAALEAELKADRAKSRVLQISEFGLVEITRQRVRPSLESRLTVSCPSCRGSGRVLSPATLGHEIRRELEKRARHGAGERLVVRARPDVLGLLQELLEAPGQEGERRIPACRLEPAEDFGPEQYEITSDAG